MPTYDYYCEDNGRTVEVSHRMAEELRTWSELCARAGLAPGATAVDAPVRKLISGAAILTGQSRGAAPAMEDCGAGAACCGGVCGAAH